MEGLTKFVNNPAYHDVLAIVKGKSSSSSFKIKHLKTSSIESACLLRRIGARNGLVYGARVRAPHALVMTILFQSGSYVSISVLFTPDVTKTSNRSVSKKIN